MKLPETFTDFVSPATTVSDAMSPTGRGARFGTVTLTDELPERPPGSLAEIEIVALPGDTAVMFTEVPDAVAVATDGFDELTE